MKIFSKRNRQKWFLFVVCQLLVWFIIKHVSHMFIFDINIQEVPKSLFSRCEKLIVQSIRSKTLIKCVEVKFVESAEFLGTSNGKTSKVDANLNISFITTLGLSGSQRLQAKDHGFTSLLDQYEIFIRVKTYSNGLLIPKSVVFSNDMNEYKGLTRRSLFFRLKIEEELDEAINGNPFNTLKKYKNPCWEARLPSNVSSIYKVNPLYVPPSQDKPRGGLFWKLLERNKADFMDVVNAGAPRRIRCSPYFFILGVTKSGTTDLYRILRRHPEICDALSKEPMYWNRVRVGGYQRNFYYTHYIDMFDPLAIKLMKKETDAFNKNLSVKHRLITGDCSPGYLWEYFGWNTVPGNTKNMSEPAFIMPHTLYILNKNVKMIIMMRNPTERFFSQYMMWYEHNSADDFHEDVVKSVTSLILCFRVSTMRHCAYNRTAGKVARYLRASLYYIFIRDWTEIFPLRQFMFVKSEEYFHSRKPIVAQIFIFLQVESDDTLLNEADEISPANTRRARADIYKQNVTDMRQDTKEILDRFYAPFNKLLANFLKNNKWLWK